MFGWTLIRTSRLEELEKSERRIIVLSNVHRWFAGWRDLDIIWDYVFAETYFGNISTCRQKYAEARGTDEYGRKEQAGEG